MAISKLNASHILERIDTGCPEMGQKIKEWRLIRGFTQEELGRRVGVTFQQIQKYESGINAVSIDKLCAIAAALSVDVSALLPTSSVNNGAQNANSNCSEYNSDEENERLLLDIVRGFRKVKSKDQRKAIHSLVKSLATCEE